MRALAISTLGCAQVCALALIFGQSAPAQEAPLSIEQMLSQANARYMHRDYAASLAFYRQIQQALEQTARQNPQRYDVLKRLAALSGAQGDYQAAIDYLQSAIEWRWEQISRDEPGALTDRIQQVNLYRAMGDFAQARAVLMAVTSKHQGLSGFRSIAMADDYSLMGRIYVDEKNYSGAAEQFESAITIRGEVSGALDVSLVPDLDRLGAVYLALHTYDQAETVFRRTLVIRESVLGTENADLLSTVDGLAYSYFGQNKFDEAEPVYQRLLHLWTKSVGETHPMLALALDKVAIFYAAQKKTGQAKAAFERANAIRANSLGAGLSNEAAQMRLTGDIASAAALYARALRVLEPPNDIYSATREQAAFNLGAVEAAATKSPSKKNDSTRK